MYTHIYIYIYMYICIYMYHYLSIYIYFCIKNVINTNCISISNPFLLNKKDSHDVTLKSELTLGSLVWC